MEVEKELETKEITIILTYSCNLRCSYCYEPKKVSKEMDLKTAKAIICQEEFSKENDKFDNITIQFMGGEPLLRFDLIRDICEWIWQQEFPIPITNISFPTNGTLLNAEMYKWFIENRDRIHPQLSFDGNRIMQDVNRSNSSEKVDLEFFAHYFPHDGVKMTLSPQTIGSLSEGVIFLHNLGFTYVEANPAYGRSINWDKHHVELLMTELNKMVDYYMEHPNLTPMHLISLPVWMVLDEDREPSHCQLGDKLVCYDCDGKSYPCHFFSPITLDDKKLKQSTELNFKEIHNKLSSSCSKCFLKTICLTCYGSNFLDTGSCINQSAFTCAQFKIYFFVSCRYHLLDANRTNDEQKKALITKILKIIKDGKRESSRNQ